MKYMSSMYCFFWVLMASQEWCRSGEWSDHHPICPDPLVSSTSIFPIVIVEAAESIPSVLGLASASIQSWEDMRSQAHSLNWHTYLDIYMLLVDMCHWAFSLLCASWVLMHVGGNWGHCYSSVSSEILKMITAHSNVGGCFKARVCVLILYWCVSALHVHASTFSFHIFIYCLCGLHKEFQSLDEKGSLWLQSCIGL